MTSWALLRFRGRKTGAAYTIVVSWHELDGKPVFLSPYRWQHNFTGGAPLTVRHGGVDLQGRGVLAADPDHVAEVVNGLLADGTAQRRLGLKLPDGHRVTSADIAAINFGVVRFEPLNGKAGDLGPPRNG
jgi:hypothetical protein